MDQSGELDAEMREMVRGEQKELVIKQLVLEADITTMLLPSDPNDDRYYTATALLQNRFYSLYYALLNNMDTFDVVRCLINDAR